MKGSLWIKRDGLFEKGGGGGEGIGLIVIKFLRRGSKWRKRNRSGKLRRMNKRIARRQRLTLRDKERKGVLQREIEKTNKKGEGRRELAGKNGRGKNLRKTRRKGESGDATFWKQTNERNMGGPKVPH